eukprot:TRINITY_DN13301_c0_g1_i1.p1 TRINITY_DN13301_c0_g1~~TRINITY_DN13301_c0_g1_i1.p1  ORF type:complete len:197 (+),score=27.20 TRINITY_DN13301_c0_g1_i1:1-591(+)
MFGLVYGLWQLLLEKETRTVLVVGLDGSGKTTLLEQIKRNYGIVKGEIDHNRIQPTVGMNIARIEASRKLKMLLWDLGGQEDMRTIWVQYYAEAQALLYLVDGSEQDEKAIEASLGALRSILSSVKFPKTTPVLIVLNKSDQPNFEKAKPEITSKFKHLLEEFQDTTVKRVFGFASCSAHTADGVTTCIEWLTENS